MTILLWMWVVFCLILLGYYVLIFKIPRENPASFLREEIPGVSIIIAIKNGHPQFTSYLKSILDQDYPLFEIIIVDDHSTPGRLDHLIEITEQHPRIRLIHLKDTNGKKNALIEGIEQASYPVILLTDADGYPHASHWITAMVRYADKNTMVLGYSPYEKQNGVLNRWIRFETLMTGMQYLSWAGHGKAYMGVGRNLLFPRDWFLQTKPLSAVRDLPYGDDDLLVQQASGQLNIIPVIAEESFIISQAASSWQTWWRQKHRHMSAGHHYHMVSWLKPGLLGIALIGHWLLLPMLLMKYPWVLIGCIMALTYRWVRYAGWTRKLGETDTLIFYPLLEAAYALYLAVMGVYTLFNRKKTWN